MKLNHLFLFVLRGLLVTCQVTKEKVKTPGVYDGPMYDPDNDEFSRENIHGEANLVHLCYSYRPNAGTPNSNEQCDSFCEGKKDKPEPKEGFGPSSVCVVRTAHSTETEVIDGTQPFFKSSCLNIHARAHEI